MIFKCWEKLNFVPVFVPKYVCKNIYHIYKYTISKIKYYINEYTKIYEKYIF